MSQSDAGPPPEGATAAGPREWVPLEMYVSVELDESLRELAERHHRTKEDELARAVALYRYLSDKAREGKRVGIAREGQSLELEIGGLD